MKELHGSKVFWKKTEHEAEKEAKITHNIPDAENKRF